MTRDDQGGTAAPVRRSAGSRQGKAVHRRGRGAAVASGPAKRRRAEGFGARLRYRFDTALSRGPSVVIGWLGLLTLVLIVVGALVMTVFRLRGVNGGEKLGFFESFWQSMLRIVDAGTFAGDTSWPTRLLGLVVTVAGIFIVGSLIGLIANAVDQRIEELRKGRSNVIESDHTVILGWSPRVPALVSELVIANESRKRAAVVVVAATDKTEMEEVLRRVGPRLEDDPDRVPQRRAVDDRQPRHGQPRTSTVGDRGRQRRRRLDCEGRARGPGVRRVRRG